MCDGYVRKLVYASVGQLDFQKSRCRRKHSETVAWTGLLRSRVLHNSGDSACLGSRELTHFVFWPAELYRWANFLSPDQSLSDGALGDVVQIKKGCR